MDLARRGQSPEEQVLPVTVKASEEPVQRRESWQKAVEDKIKQQVQGANQSIPPYFQRLDAFENISHPSIFKLPGEPSHVTVAAIGPYPRPGEPVITYAKKCGIVNFMADRLGLKVGEFLDWVRHNDKKARNFYERDSLNMDAEKLAEMLLLDGCLVLLAVFLLRSSVREDGRPSKMADGEHGKEFIYISADIIFHMKQLRLDLLALDNQIPFFVVAQLHQQLEATMFIGIPYGIEEMALSCFDEIHPKRHRDITNDSGTAHHLLQLFHWSRVPSDKYNVDIDAFLPREPESHIPSATELRESATAFRRKPPGGSPLDISFRRRFFRVRGIMSIPTIYLYDYSEPLFRSLLAFEQSHLKCGLGVTVYCVCMGRLLQSETDGKLLRKNRIIAHTLMTDEEIVHFFRKLSSEHKNTCIPKDLLALYSHVEEHHKNRVSRMFGGIILQYFPNRWITISVICGAIIFFATLANNIHSVYRYYHPLTLRH